MLSSADVVAEQPIDHSRGLVQLVFDPMSIVRETNQRAFVAMGLALTCLLGRGLNLLIPGRTPVWAMAVMFIMASSAVVLGTTEIRARTADEPERLIAKLAQRIGLIQVLFAIALVIRGLIS